MALDLSVLRGDPAIMAFDLPVLGSDSAVVALDCAALGGDSAVVAGDELHSSLDKLEDGVLAHVHRRLLLNDKLHCFLDVHQPNVITNPKPSGWRVPALTRFSYAALASWPLRPAG